MDLHRVRQSVAHLHFTNMTPDEGKALELIHKLLDELEYYPANQCVDVVIAEAIDYTSTSTEADLFTR